MYERFFEEGGADYTSVLEGLHRRGLRNKKTGGSQIFCLYLSESEPKQVKKCKLVSPEEIIPVVDRADKITLMREEWERRKIGDVIRAELIRSHFFGEFPCRIYDKEMERLDEEGRIAAPILSFYTLLPGTIVYSIVRKPYSPIWEVSCFVCPHTDEADHWRKLLEGVLTD